MKVRNTKEAEKIELQMTPMIDIVFQLLIFFIMQFKIVQLEGDFNIKMPAQAASAGTPEDDELPPMKLRLRAADNGGLASINLNDVSFNDLNGLHAHVANLVGGDDAGPGAGFEGAEVELDCDYNLRYENVVAAITAVSGKVGDDGRIIKLIEKIKFAPPKQQP
jgi:biopolymer transport protein ExbD